MKKSDIIIKQVPLFLEWYESSYDKENGVYYGGVALPKYTDELCIDIYDDYLFNFKKDDFEKTGRHVLDIGGSSRAMRELGKFLVNSAMYKCKSNNYYEIIENVCASDENRTANLIVYRKGNISRILFSLAAILNGCKNIGIEHIGKQMCKMMCDKKTTRIDLMLKSFKSRACKKEKWIEEGIIEPKYMNELIIDVIAGTNNQTVLISGTDRAIKEFGMYLVNFSLYTSLWDDFHEHFDGIRGYNYRKNVNIIVRKS